MATSFNDPFAAYNAATNLEAHSVCLALQNAGINATVVEDVSVVGLWFGGTLPFHNPQVWIERADAQRAAQVLREYENAEATHRAAENGESDHDEPLINATCEECGKTSLFPESLIGTIQPCPHCSAFLDVGDDPGFDDWQVDKDGDEPSVEATCEECGQTSQFPAALSGTIQYCHHCSAFVDVGDDPGFDDWKVNEQGNEPIV